MSGVAMEIIRIGRVLSTEYMDPYQMPYGSRPGSPSDHISVPIRITIGIRLRAIFGKWDDYGLGMLILYLSSQFLRLYQTT